MGRMFLLILLGLLLFSPNWKGEPEIRLENQTVGPIGSEFEWREKFYLVLSVMEGGAELYSIGPYSIHHDFWKDAIDFDPTIGGFYKECQKIWYSRRIIDAYFRRHCAEAWRDQDIETLARTFNGGPRGPFKISTKDYGQRFVDLYKVMK